MEDLVIIGAGGFGQEVAWLVERVNAAGPRWNILGWIDDTPAKQGTAIGGYPVLGGVESVAKCAGASLVCAIGSAEARRSVLTRAEEHLTAQPRYATLIDPGAYMAPTAAVGAGSIVCAGSIVSVGVTIGRHVVVNWACTVGHDVVLRDYVTLYPSVNVSGKTGLGMCVEMGAGSRTIPAISIGANTIVGAGSTVVKDLPSDCTAVGSPAQPIKFRTRSTPSQLGRLSQ